jgi:flavin reductase (DIM6/NTAB) family NADH-FMN oxidoreductase RutF
MAKIKWKSGNMVYPLPAVIVTCGENESEYTGLTIAWTGTICTNPPMTYVSIRPTRHSYEIIKRQGGFVINLTTEDIVYETDYLGVVSGAKEQKLKVLGLDYDLGEVIRAPLLKKSPVCIECKTVEIKELGSHHMFLAEVVHIHVEEELLDESNKFHLEKSNPIVYSHGSYFGLGQYKGKFGYSVQKPSTQKSNFKKTSTQKSNSHKKPIKKKSS